MLLAKWDFCAKPCNTRSCVIRREVLLYSKDERAGSLSAQAEQCREILQQRVCVRDGHEFATIHSAVNAVNLRVRFSLSEG